MMRRLLATYVRSETGAATFTMLFVLGLVMLVGGLALDVANKHRAEATLQAAADMAAASGAVYLSEPDLGVDPEEEAFRTFKASLEKTNMSDAWVDRSFRLGTYDDATGEFTTATLDEVPDAVRVTLVRSPKWGNGEPTLLLRLIGVREWDIRVTSIAHVKTAEALPCPSPLLSLQTKARIGSADAFAGVCVTAQASLTSGPAPQWMTDSATALIGGLLKPVVLPDVLSQPLGFLNHVRTADALEDVIREARALRGDTFNITELISGQSYRISCPSSGVLSLRGPLMLDNVALLSECPVRFDADVEARTSLIITNLKSLAPQGRLRGVVSDAKLSDGRGCDQGNGVRVYLFVSAVCPHRCLSSRI